MISQAQPGFHSPYAGANSVPARRPLADLVRRTVYARLRGADADDRDRRGARVGRRRRAVGRARARRVHEPRRRAQPVARADAVRRPRVHRPDHPARRRRRAGRAHAAARSSASCPRAASRSAPARCRRSTCSTSTRVGTDSHLQFMNWTIDNNGAYDYAADTRGYTLGAIDRVRGAAVGGAVRRDADADGRERHRLRLRRRERARREPRGRGPRVHRTAIPGSCACSGICNHARMGSYDEAIADVRRGPDEAARHHGDAREGRARSSASASTSSRSSTDGLRAFARLGWNDGDNESFAYTEVDNTRARRRRRQARAARRQARRRGGQQRAVAAAPRLPRARRRTASCSATARCTTVARTSSRPTTRCARTAACSPAIDVQVIDHPGYNTDRGPVVVGSLRLHVEL